MPKKENERHPQCRSENQSIGGLPSPLFEQAKRPAFHIDGVRVIIGKPSASRLTDNIAFGGKLFIGTLHSRLTDGKLT